LIFAMKEGLYYFPESKGGASLMRGGSTDSHEESGHFARTKD